MIRTGMARGPKLKHNNSKTLGVRADEALHKKLDKYLKRIKRAGIEPNKSDFTRYIIRHYADVACADYIEDVKNGV